MTPSELPGSFTHDTTVEQVADGRYLGTVSPAWAAIDGHTPNGGYLMALAARAMRGEAPEHPDPITLTAHFLRPAEPGEAEIDVEVVRTGRRTATLAASLRQDGRERVRLLGAFADLGRDDGPTWVDRRPPELPPIEDCIDVTRRSVERVDAGGRPLAPILGRFDHRWPPEHTGWADGDPLGRGRMGGYLRWADGTDMDTLGLLVAADCYPPAVFNTGESALAWVPTVELTVQVRKRPAPGFLATRFVTTAVTNGYLEEDGEVWDADGELVVLSRQLALSAR